MRIKLIFLIMAVSAGLGLPAAAGGWTVGASTDAQAAPQNEHRVSGRVVDLSGEPVVGAAVFVEGKTGKGTTTGADGSFSLIVGPDDVLTVSCIGFKSQQVVPGGRSNLEIVLEEDSTLLEETVVVGYGVQKKVNVSGAVSSVNMEDVLGDRPQPNVAAALQGAIPGLHITGSSSPGQTGKSIQIRGTSSFSGSSTGVSGISPLVLIDNVPGDIDALNPEDIESVSVLKDASASAIYGARAAAGVILITTKRPKGTQKVTVSYNGAYGMTRTLNHPERLGIEDFVAFYKDAFNTDQYTAAQNQNLDKWVEYLNIYRTNPSSLGSLGTLQDNGIFTANEDGLRYYLMEEDLNERMMETGTSWNHNIAVSGGTDNIRFRISANSYNENGPLYSNKDLYDRKAVNAIVSADVTRWLTQELDIYYTQQKRDMLVDETGSLYGQRNHDFLPDGTDPDGYLVRSPRNIIDVSNVANTLTEQPRIFTKTILRPFKGLEAVFEYTYQKKGSDYNYYSGKYTMTDLQLNVLNGPDHDYYITRRFYETRNDINAYATYRFEPWAGHNFSIMGGYSQEYMNYAYFDTRAEDQAIMNIPSMSNAQGQVKTSDNYHDYAIRSGFFRFNYDYDNRYILEVSGRYDGSSKFPKASRFGFFPSFSVAWNIANEPFMAGTRGWLDQLKPRFSYGSIGNQSSVGYYDYISSMVMSTQSTVWLSGSDSGYVTAIGIPGIVSNSFTWETITTMNAGIDFAAFKNRLTGSFDWFTRDTKNILSESVALPAVLGTTAPMQNVGAMRTTGWELQIGWKGSFGRDGGYNVGFNISDYTSVVTSLNFNEEKSLSYLYEGQSVGEIWGYKWDGFYTVDDFSDLSTWKLKDGVTAIQGVNPRPGDYKFKNLRDGDYSETDENTVNNGKNTVDNPGDMVVIGNSTPRYQYGFNFGADFKGVSLSVLLQGVGKRDYYLNGPYFYTSYAGNDAIWFPVFKGTEDYWRPVSTDASDPNYYVQANPDARLPRVYGTIGNSGSNRRTNDHMLQNAAYLRLKNVTLSYSFPKALLQKISVKALRIYVSGENLATLTSLPNGLDPETIAWGYPFYRTVSFGLNITL